MTAERIRVLWLSKGLGPGGLERLLVSFAGLADHQRFDLRAAFLLPWKDHLVAELDARGVTPTCLDVASAADPRWLLRLLRLVREHQPEVVHVHSPLVAAAARPALRALPIASRPSLVGTEHNVWSAYRAPTRWANRLTLPLQQATLAVSEGVRGSMPPSLAGRTDVLIHGVDAEAIAERRPERESARRELGVGDGELLVATVANLRPSKDYPTLLRAARRLVDGGSAARFVSVGQGPLEAELVAERDRLDLGGRFEFLGYREDPVRVLVAADLFCLSSRYEGLPIALLEAMAAGLPVVVTAVGGVAAVVQDGREGRVVPPRDPVALAEGVAALADASVRLRCSEAAATRAQDFTMTRAVDHQQELYARLAAPVRLERGEMAVENRA